LAGPDLGAALQDALWWAKVESTASRIIAISRGLEQGKAVKPAAHSYQPPAGQPERTREQLDEDVPF
jgi:hypothetical protein